MIIMAWKEVLWRKRRSRVLFPNSGGSGIREERSLPQGCPYLLEVSPPSLKGLGRKVSELGNWEVCFSHLKEVGPLPIGEGTLGPCKAACSYS